MNLIYQIFGWPLGWVMWLLYQIIPVYFIALILFTIVTRAALVPIAIKQQKSTIKMQLYQPRIQEIQKKYANNREKMSEEMSKLYEEEGYNPMMGCLPMLIQLPIILGLYDVIQRPLTHLLHISGEVITKATEIASSIIAAAGTQTVDLARDMSSQIKIISVVQANPAAFAGLGDFAEKVQSLKFNIGPIDLTAMPQWGDFFQWIWLIPVLSLVTSLLMSLVTMKQTAAQTGGDNPAAGMTKGMMLMMPLMSGYFAVILPAGLGVYWIMSNILMTIQSYVLNKYMNPREMAEKAKAEYEAKRERDRQEKIEAKKRARETGVDLDKAKSQKEINRLKLAEARKKAAEKYGEEYTEVTDDDLK